MFLDLEEYPELHENSSKADGHVVSKWQEIRQGYGRACTPTRGNESVLIICMSSAMFSSCTAFDEIAKAQRMNCQSKNKPCSRVLFATKTRAKKDCVWQYLNKLTVSRENMKYANYQLIDRPE